jgi:hypothetical protein
LHWVGRPRLVRYNYFMARKELAERRDKKQSGLARVKKSGPGERREGVVVAATKVGKIVPKGVRFEITSTGINPPASPLEREAVIERAVEVIGDREQAMRWLGTPVRALDYATPISRLHDKEGQAGVLRVLTQLEHGVL